MLTFLFVRFAALARRVHLENDQPEGCSRALSADGCEHRGFRGLGLRRGKSIPAWAPGLYNPLLGGIVRIVFTLASGLVRTH
jgi:hypothetical protein